ncbi:helix-turn-helix domain-containing protein [Streptomyces sp. MRC013]|uniref:helix-turn-helix domain-containing protein n=1 Tax=Streptomyces sp. MRC013 TaxID=2898276 RepID=UPI002026A430|nr:helix-turn-helix domain-containing protein [Streptomyces sp. MRC013]URM89386.1 helix-turn-helix domain-containing protein [Streptomyces sp. MRC013]
MSIGNAPDGNSPADDRPPLPEDDRPSIGRALRDARLAANLTVEEVSHSTRVRVPIVYAIEEDDFSRCGGDVYARGHVRTLARAVGLDPAALVEQYDAEHGGRPAPTSAAPMFEAERIRPERRRPNWTAAMVAAIVVVVGFAGFTLFGQNGAGTGSGSAASGQASARPPSQAPKPAPSKPAPIASESAIAAVPQDKVTVKLTAIDDKSWISAKARDGKLLFDGLLEKGDSKTFQDDERLDLILGNAGVIELFVNGKKVQDEFAPGQVERLTYTRGDPEVG